MVNYVRLAAVFVLFWGVTVGNINPDNAYAFPIIIELINGIELSNQRNQKRLSEQDEQDDN